MSPWGEPVQPAAPAMTSEAPINFKKWRRLAPSGHSQAPGANSSAAHSRSLSGESNSSSVCHRWSSSPAENRARIDSTLCLSSLIYRHPQ